MLLKSNGAFTFKALAIKMTFVILLSMTTLKKSKSLNRQSSQTLRFTFHILTFPYEEKINDMNRPGIPLLLSSFHYDRMASGGELT